MDRIVLFDFDTRNTRSEIKSIMKRIRDGLHEREGLSEPDIIVTSALSPDGTFRGGPYIMVVANQEEDAELIVDVLRNIEVGIAVEVCIIKKFIQEDKM